MPRELNGCCDSEGVIEGFNLVVMRRVGCGRDAPQLGRVDEAVRGGRKNGWVMPDFDCELLIVGL